MKISIRAVWVLLCCGLMSFACNSYRPNITLWEAAKSGDTKAMLYYAKHKQNIDEKNDRGDTALAIACANLNLEIVEILLKNGAMVNKSNYLTIVLGRLLLSKDDSDSLSLENLSQTQKEERANVIIQQLLKHGADANKISSLEGFVFTPLLLAIQARNLKIVQLLISSGADVNKTGKKPDGEELVPLIEAIVRNETDIAKELIRHGADIKKHKIVEGGKLTTLELSIVHNNAEIVKELLKAGAVDDDLTIGEAGRLTIAAALSDNEEIMKIVSVYVSPDKDENYIFKMMSEAKQRQ